jgi:hypothetical protein
MEEKSPEKRKSCRYPAALEVTIYEGGRTAQGQIVQISRGGCLLKMPPPPVAQGLEMRLTFGLSADLPSINCKGEVIYYIADRGMGVAFTEISTYYQDLITSYFEKQP